LNLGGTGISTPDSFCYRSFSFRSSFRFRSRSRSSSCSTTSGDIFYCSGSRQLNHSSWYFHCDFQQNIALFVQYQSLCYSCYSLTHRVQYSGDTENCFFFRGHTGREVTVETVVEVYPIPQPCRGSGERRKLSREVWGGAPAETVFGRFMRNFVPF